jgi:hypothetical protein
MKKDLKDAKKTPKIALKHWVKYWVKTQNFQV